MKLFTDKYIKRLFCEIVLCAVLFSVFSAVFAVSENAALYIYISAVCMAAAIIVFCCRFFLRQNKIIEQAAAKISASSRSHAAARIDCDEEGELNKLFHEINSLSAILNTHAQNELRSKQFLKNTIADISHQLKTPLAALNIYNGILQDDATDSAERRQFLILSEQELDRIETLVQSLLKITKLDAGTVAIDKKDEPLFKLLEQIQKRFAFRASQEQKQILLTGSADARLFCDRIWLSEAIENIVKNALDHTAAGDAIHIECRQFPSLVQITVKDNGSGIHPQDLHHIFKRFYRSRFSKDTQGIGLGLALAKSVIEAHNGSIEADSVLGSGTTFTINFLIPTKL